MKKRDLRLRFFIILMCCTNVVLWADRDKTTESLQNTISSFKSESSMSNVDFVIFSFDRPMQLYALLESTFKYCTGLGQTYVIFRASSPEYQHAYYEVKRKFSQVNFWQQSNAPHSDFKTLTINATFATTNTHVMYGVDDIIVKDSIDLLACANLIDVTKSYGFYLRLGRNTTESYSMRQEDPVPMHTEIASHIMRWQFLHGRWDWNYPNTLDMTIYRKNDIEYFIRNLPYVNPNSLEGRWAQFGNSQLFGLCYASSKIVNLPLNLVNISGNRTEAWKTPAQLLELFNQGLKIDIEPVHALVNKSPHSDYKPQFTKREHEA